MLGAVYSGEFKTNTFWGKPSGLRLEFTWGIPCGKGCLVGATHMMCIPWGATHMMCIPWGCNAYDVHDVLY